MNYWNSSLARMRRDEQLVRMSAVASRYRTGMFGTYAPDIPVPSYGNRDLRSGTELSAASSKFADQMAEGSSQRGGGKYGPWYPDLSRYVPRSGGGL